MGKGSGGRAFHRKGRSANWKAAAKNGFEAVIYRDNLFEYCAFSIEKILIFALGMTNLVNVATGGQGCSGWSPPQEYRDKLSKIMKGRPLPDAARSPEAMAKRRVKMLGRVQTDEHKKKVSRALKGVPKGGKEFDFYHADHGHVRATCGILRSSYGLDRNVLRLANGRIPSTKGWTLLERGGKLGRRIADEHHMSDLTVRTFSHPKSGIFTGTRHEFAKAYNLRMAGIGKLVRGERKSTAGWRIIT